MSDPDLQKDIKHWPFSIVGRDQKPVIRVEHNGMNREFVRILQSAARETRETELSYPRLRKKSAPWSFPK